MGKKRDPFGQGSDWQPRVATPPDPPSYGFAVVRLESLFTTATSSTVLQDDIRLWICVDDLYLLAFRFRVAAWELLFATGPGVVNIIAGGTITIQFMWALRICVLVYPNNVDLGAASQSASAFESGFRTVGTQTLIPYTQRDPHLRFVAGHGDEVMLPPPGGERPTISLPFSAAELGKNWVNLTDETGVVAPDAATYRVRDFDFLYQLADLELQHQVDQVTTKGTAGVTNITNSIRTLLINKGLETRATEVQQALWRIDQWARRSRIAEQLGVTGSHANSDHPAGYYQPINHELWPHIDPYALADELRARVLNPFMVSQGSMYWCGPASAVFEWCRRRPLEYVNAAIECLELGLFLTGNSREVAGIQVPTAYVAGEFRDDAINTKEPRVSYAEWLVCGTMEASTSWFNFTSKNRTALDGTTTAPVMEDYIFNLLGESSSFVFAPTEFATLASAATQGRFVFLAISTELLGMTPPWYTKVGVPDHWVLLLPGARCSLLEHSNDLLWDFHLYTWGSSEGPNRVQGYPWRATATGQLILKTVKAAVISAGK